MPIGLELDKPKRIQMSDWSRVPLSAPQIQYAALDAAVSRWYRRLRCTHTHTRSSGRLPLGCVHLGVCTWVCAHDGEGTVKDGHGNTGDGVDTHASRKRS